jgi:hypothetical protein
MRSGHARLESAAVNGFPHHSSLFPVSGGAELGGGFVLSWDMMAKDRMSKYWLGWLVGCRRGIAGVCCHLRRRTGTLAALRIAFIMAAAHFGHVWPHQAGSIAGPIWWLSIITQSARLSRQFYLDSLVHGGDALRQLIRLVGGRLPWHRLSIPAGTGAGQIIESLVNADCREARLRARQWVSGI